MTESQRKNAESQRKTPDREKVIRGLKCCSSGGCYDPCCPYNDPEENNCVGCTSKLAADALALLREQEPVKPRWTHPAVDMNVMMCGSCGIEIPLGKPNYCPWCGRKVKWNDAE